ncbi:MAG: hypothetical protein HY294_08560 [Candidatus Rokubacteria bacterium]|nr:hypothetical protein [Candidatus Rokubacteria bacterium]MBI3826034.1 hypothetical protein [Candidatus Rokubacteria bacterium]
MRRLVWSLGLLALAGCGGPVIMENPTTKARVNCTTEAMRGTAPSEYSETGKGVPQKADVAPALQQFDLERRCASELRQEGYVCIAGC